MAGVWVAWVIFSAQFEHSAAQYDLSQMDKMESASIIYDRTGVEMGKIFIQNRNPVPLDKINPLMVKAVIAAEDNKFYQHSGVDYMGILRAAVANYRRGKISQGASTVTQQLARNSFELRERTYKRKFVEMYLAQRIEKNFSKDKIMEMYLNRVYFGSGFYGVEAAARGYFGKSAAELDVGQCAMLAGLLKSPQALSPWNNKDGATQTRNFVLRRMNELGFLSNAEYKAASDTTLLVMRRTNPFKVSYAIDYIRQQAVAALGFEQAMNGGFRIETTLDLKMQKVAERTMRDVLAKIESSPGYKHPTFESYRESVKVTEEQINQGNMSVKLPEPKYMQGAIMALDNNTGGILVMVGGRDFKHSEYNRAVMGRRPLGTAFTPFVFAAAYDKGVFPGEIVEDACIDNRYVMVGGDSGILGEWGVERADNDYEGPITTRDALARGKNAATVRLGFQVSLDQVKKVSAAAGIASPLRDYANSFLGSSEATLDEATLAYTIFPNGGQRPKDSYMISRILDSSGNVVYKNDSGKVKAISPAAAFQTNAGLEDALRRGTGAIAFTSYGLEDRPFAGKTGTAYNFTDTYFFGYDSSVTCGVWVGFDKPTRIYRGAFGKDLALPIWSKVMNAAAAELPANKFTKPSTVQQVEICRVSGLLATPGCLVEVANASTGANDVRPTTYMEWATDEQIPTIKCDIHGGGIRNYAKEYSQDQWPRAAAAIDLATVRPIAMTSPSLVGLSDVYNSIRPDSQKFQDSIPVAKAIPVVKDDLPAANDPAVSDPTPDAPPSDGTQIPVAIPVDGSEPEIRKAEPVTPLDTPLDSPAIKSLPPEPITF